VSGPAHDPDSDETSPLQKHRSLLFLLVVVAIVVTFAVMFLINYLGGGSGPFQ
jgi:hypothetical protein